MTMKTSWKALPGYKTKFELRKCCNLPWVVVIHMYISSRRWIRFVEKL